MQTKETLKENFDRACAELVNEGVEGIGEGTFYSKVYVKMFGTFPQLISVALDGFYLNPNAEESPLYDDEDEDDEDEYTEEEDEEVYTFENLSIQKTFINFAEKFRDTAHIVRRDDFPTIVADHFIMYWNEFTHQMFILQEDEYLSDELKALVVDKKNDKDNRWFSYVTTTSQGFSDTAMRVKKQDVDLSTNYNDDLPHETIVEFLKSQRSGLILLHGVPGSGKTTYIRHLMHEVKGRRFLVLDSSVFAYITDASFINLLLANKNSVIILEDCETMLADRLTSNNGLLPTLLNISDGIIGDSFNFKFICTFNADMSSLDKALLRKGRMKLRYEFKELTADKTEALAKKLGKDIPSGQSLPLSEIYNYGEDNGAKKKGKTKVGF